MESFKAATQYGDWEGSTKADDSDSNRVLEHLRKQGLVNENEFLIAISFYSGEHGFTYVRAFVFDKGTHYESVKSALDANDNPIKVREVDVKLTAQEFLALFKRFSIVLTWHGLELEDREYYTD